MNSDVSHQEYILGRLLKIVGSLAAAIILGAIGSGVWEKILSPAISWLSSATAEFISTFSSSYENSIFQRAARDMTDLYPVKIVFLILFIIGFSLVTSMLLQLLAKYSFQERTQRRLKFLLGANGLFLGIAIVVMSFISIAKVDAAQKIKEKSFRSLEILRPYIGEQEYLVLRSTYYSIDNKSDFDVFRSLVRTHAGKINKKVPLLDGDK